MSASLYWALRLIFVDDQDAILWQTVVAPSARVRLRQGVATPRDVLGWIDGITRDLAPNLAAAAVSAHADHLVRLTCAVRDATAALLLRERAIAAAIRGGQGRLALPLLQPGLFDRRALRHANVQRRLLDEALARTADRLTRLDRLRAPLEGERSLLFVAAVTG